MMNLKMQIHLILYSFLYGFILSILLDINYKYSYKKSLLIKYIISFLFAINASLIYFFFLQKINNGILHPYSFLWIIIGFTLSHFTNAYLDKHHKKWYTKKEK